MCFGQAEFLLSSRFMRRRILYKGMSYYPLRLNRGNDECAALRSASVSARRHASGSSPRSAARSARDSLAQRKAPPARVGSPTPSAGCGLEIGVNDVVPV